MRRDYSIDILRFIALTGIIAVCCVPNTFITQLRNFDVPLMVFLSGVSYNLTVGGGILSYSVAILITYIQNRIVTKIIAGSKNEKLNKNLSIIFKG